VERNFIWGNTDSGRGIHWVKWDSVAWCEGFKIIDKYGITWESSLAYF